MRVAFVHLSDIHFGQERNKDLHINNDIKEAVIQDCRRQIQELAPESVAGVLITGDLAYSGKRAEYENAGAWLDRLTAAIGCARTAVRIVPGNHDIDRDEISESIGDMLAAIEAIGEDKLIRYLKNEHDRNALLRRFQDYRLFAEAYDCSLDTDGGWAGDHIVELDEGRTLRILGVNSALTCKKKDAKGKLLLGSKQMTLQVRTPGEELIVLTHHPLDWFQDSDEARKYLRKRARIYLSGHEHNPAVKVDPVSPTADLLTIAAGATVPPTEEGPLKFCYNVLQFETVAGNAELRVTVSPRKWDPDETEFVEDIEQLKAHGKSFDLKCPNFSELLEARKKAVPMSAANPAAPGTAPSPVLASAPPSPPTQGQLTEDFPLLVLRFFRDLNDAQRVEALVQLGALPEDWSGPLSHVIERRGLERLRSAGKLGALKEYLNLRRD